MNYDSRLNPLIKKIRDGKLHWPPASLPGIVAKGFLSTHGIPQGECAWTLRTNEKVRLIYEHLHQSNDLVVGMDVVFFNSNEAHRVNKILSGSRINYLIKFYLENHSCSNFNCK